MLDPALRNMQSTHRYIHIAYSYILLVTQDMSKQRWDWGLGWVQHREGRCWCWIAGGRDAGFAELKYLSRTMMDAADVAD